MKKYEEGFYWAALQNAEEWTVAHRFNKQWYVPGIEERIPENEIEIAGFIGGERPYHPTKGSGND